MAEDESRIEAEERYAEVVNASAEAHSRLGEIARSSFSRIEMSARRAYGEFSRFNTLLGEGARLASNVPVELSAVKELIEGFPIDLLDDVNKKFKTQIEDVKELGTWFEKLPAQEQIRTFNDLSRIASEYFDEEMNNAQTLLDEIKERYNIQRALYGISVDTAKTQRAIAAEWMTEHALAVGINDALSGTDALIAEAAKSARPLETRIANTLASWQEGLKYLEQFEKETGVIVESARQVAPNFALIVPPVEEVEKLGTAFDKTGKYISAATRMGRTGPMLQAVQDLNRQYTALNLTADEYRSAMLQLADTSNTVAAGYYLKTKILGDYDLILQKTGTHSRAMYTGLPQAIQNVEQSFLRNLDSLGKLVLQMNTAGASVTEMTRAVRGIETGELSLIKTQQALSNGLKSLQLYLLGGGEAAKAQNKELQKVKYTFDDLLNGTITLEQAMAEWSKINLKAAQSQTAVTTGVRPAITAQMQQAEAIRIAKSNADALLETFKGLTVREKDLVKRHIEAGSSIATLSAQLRPLVTTFLRVSFAEQGVTAQIRETDQVVEELSDEIATHIVRSRKWYQTHNLMQMQLQKVGKQLTLTGSRIGFYGWIVRYTAISLIKTFQQLWNLVNQVISVGANWTETLQNIVRAEALLAATGELTTEQEELFNQAIEDTLDIGPDVQATMSGISATVSALGLTFSENLLPYLVNFANRLAELASDPSFRDFIGELAEFIGEKLFPAILNVIQGFEDWWPVIEPVAGALLDLLTVLGPLTPLLYVLGEFFFTHGPAMTAAGVAIKGLADALGASSTGAAKLTGALTTLAPFLAAVAIAVAAIAVHWDELVDYWREEVEPHLVILRDSWDSLNQKVSDLTGGLGIAESAFDAFKIATEPLIGVFENLLRYFSQFLDMVSRVLDVIGGIVTIFDSLKKMITSTNHEMVEWVGETDDAFGHSIGKDIVMDLAPAISSLQRFNEEMSNTRRNIGTLAASPTIGTPGGSPVTEHMTVNLTMEIGNVSSEIDLIRIQDAASRGIAEARARRSTIVRRVV